MKHIYLIRHGESISNAGEVTSSHDTIPLTQKGRNQAEILAKTLNVVPDLIIVSSYIRTQETAAPFIAKHPAIPVEVWDVHEFTYLGTKIYEGTTKEERQQPSFDYWENADIRTKYAEHAESFYTFTKRIEDFLEKLKTRTEQTIVVFSHGRFIYALKLYLAHLQERGVASLLEEDIRFLKQLHAEGVRGKTPFPIGNTSVHKIEL